MFKKIMVVSGLLVVSSFSNAGVIEPRKIDQSVNDVVEMKSFDNGAIRIFLVDQQEPASRPYKVVVSLPAGGDELTQFGSFETGSFCSVDLTNATSVKKQTSSSVNRVISIPVAHYDLETGSCQLKDTLTLDVLLTGSNESSLKASTGK